MNQPHCLRCGTFLTDETKSNNLGSLCRNCSSTRGKHSFGHFHYNSISQLIFAEIDTRFQRSQIKLLLFLIGAIFLTLIGLSLMFAVLAVARDKLGFADPSIGVPLVLFLTSLFIKLDCIDIALLLGSNQLTSNSFSRAQLFRQLRSLLPLIAIEAIPFAVGCATLLFVPHFLLQYSGIATLFGMLVPTILYFYWTFNCEYMLAVEARLSTAFMRIFPTTSSEFFIILFWNFAFIAIIFGLLLPTLILEAIIIPLAPSMSPIIMGVYIYSLPILFALIVNPLFLALRITKRKAERLKITGFERSFFYEKKQSQTAPELPST